MASSFFLARLVPNRPNFVTTMTPDELATMGAHGAFLQSQLAAGTLVVAALATLRVREDEPAR